MSLQEEKIWTQIQRCTQRKDHVRTHKEAAVCNRSERSQETPTMGRAGWFTLVIPALWEAEGVDHLRAGV